MSSVGVSHEARPFRLTRHARERAAERGIPLEVVGIILLHGIPIRDERGDRYSLQGVRRPSTIPRGLWRQALGVIVPVDPYGWIPTLIKDSGARAGTERG